MTIDWLNSSLSRYPSPTTFFMSKSYLFIQKIDFFPRVCSHSSLRNPCLWKHVTVFFLMRKRAFVGSCVLPAKKQIPLTSKKYFNLCWEFQCLIHSRQEYVIKGVGKEEEKENRNARYDASLLFLFDSDMSFPVYSLIFGPAEWEQELHQCNFFFLLQIWVVR